MVKRILVVAVVATAGSVFASAAMANHSWGNYHWARTANPSTIKLGNNLSSSWTTHLNQSSTDWNRSTVLKNTIVAGRAKGNCRPTSGRDEVCNKAYGYNGWLGVAQIWLTTGNHIAQGVVKVNDSYFSLAQYNNVNEKRHVMCQEIGHTWGLDHQDESGASLNTCMDYYHNTSNTDTKSISPNQHDYDQLGTIYSHTDSFNSWTAPARESVHVDRLPNGMRLVTWVLWANPIHSAL